MNADHSGRSGKRMTDGFGPTVKVFDPCGLARKPSGWTRARLCSSLRAQSASPGGVAERLNAPVLKTGSPSRGSWVQIPPPPPDSSDDRFGRPRIGGPLRTQLCRAKLDTRASARVWSRASSRGMSSAPALLTIPPPKVRPLFSSFPAARVTDARGFFHSGVAT